MSLTVIYNFLTTLQLADYLLLLLFTILIIASIRQGLSKSLFNLLWLLLFFFIATYYYYLLANYDIFKHIIADSNQRLLVVFINIIALLYFARFIVYSTIKKTLTITNPCWLNIITFWLLIIILANVLALLVVQSFYFTPLLAFATINPLYQQNFLYMIILITVIALVIAVLHLFKINLTNSKQCILLTPYQKILTILHSMARFLVAKHHITIMDFFMAGIIGFIRATVIVIFILLIARYSTITSTNFWSDTVLLQYFQDFAVIIEQYLSKQLLFL